MTNQSKSYAFVAFSTFEASDAALESLNNQYLLNRPITVTYALKKDGKGGERHGTAAERLLAAQARKNNALPGPGGMGMGMEPQGGFRNPNGAPLSSMGMGMMVQPNGFPGPPPSQVGPGMYSGPPPLGAGMMNGPPNGFQAPQTQGQEMMSGNVPMYSGPPPGNNGYDGQSRNGGYGGRNNPSMTGSNMAPLGPRGGGS